MHRTVHAVLPLSLLAALYLLLRAPLLNNALTHDEIYNTACYLHPSASVARPVFLDGEILPSYGKTWRTDLLRLCTIHPPLLSGGYWLWIRLFGDGEVSLHLPVLIMGMAGVWVLFLLARMLFGATMGYLSSVAMIVSGSHLMYSVQAVYAVTEGLLILLSLLMLSRLLIGEDRKSFRALVVVNLLGLCFFYHYVFYFFIQTVVCRIRRRRIRLPRAYYYTCVLVCAVFVFAVVTNARHKRYVYRHWPPNTVAQAATILFHLPWDFTR